MSAATERYAGHLEKIQALGDEAARLQDEHEIAQESLLAAVDSDWTAGHITRGDVIDAYFAYRDATGQPGFATRWDAFVRLSYKDIHRYTHNGIGRANGPDGTWTGPFPLAYKDPAPVSGVSVAYALFSPAGAYCYIGSTKHLRARLKRHDGDGKQFNRWQAWPCADRRAAYALETKMIDAHNPYLNRMGGHR